MADFVISQEQYRYLVDRLNYTRSGDVLGKGSDEIGTFDRVSGKLKSGNAEVGQFEIRSGHHGIDEERTSYFIRTENPKLLRELKRMGIAPAKETLFTETAPPPSLGPLRSAVLEKTAVDRALGGIDKGQRENAQRRLSNIGMESFVLTPPQFNLVLGKEASQQTLEMRMDRYRLGDSDLVSRLDEKGGAYHESSIIGPLGRGGGSLRIYTNEFGVPRQYVLTTSDQILKDRIKAVINTQIQAPKQQESGEKATRR